MDKKSALGMILCVLFYFGYMQYLQNKYPDYYSPPIPTEEVGNPQNSIGSPDDKITAKPGSAPPPPKTSAVDQNIVDLSIEDLTLETDQIIVQFQQQPLALRSVLVKGHQAVLGSPDPVELLEYPMIIKPFLDEDKAQVLQLPRDSKWSALRESKNSLLFSHTDQEKKTIHTARFSIGDDGFSLKLVTESRLNGRPLENARSGVLIRPRFHPVEASGFSFLPAFTAEKKSVVMAHDGSLEEHAVSALCNATSGDSLFSGSHLHLDFVGIDLHYFLIATYPDPLGPKLDLDMVATKVTASREAPVICSADATASQLEGPLKDGGIATHNFAIFLGPKSKQVLDQQANPALRNSIKFGWFGFIAKPLLALLKFFYSLTLNFGIAIILVTILLKLAFYPLTRAAAISMKKMQKLSPEMNRIREKYKDDRTKQQQEIMRFMSQHKINPAKGCLPILPQIPVFIAFFNLLSHSIELRHAPFFGWLSDLSEADPFYITPIFLGVLMLVQQKLTPNPSMDKTQEKILMMMPIVFTFMMLSLPAGLVVYMITNTIVSIGQQQWLNKRLKV